MEIENHKEEVPFGYYQGLFEKSDPGQIASRLPETAWDGREFTLTLLGKTYKIAHPVYGICCGTAPTPVTAVPCHPLPGERALEVPSLQVQTFLLRYLLESKPAAWGGTWKTFREMPWGEMYIKPYTGRVLTRAAFTFGTRLESFRAACQKMGAMPLNHADAGYQFDFIGGYQMQILVWEGDEEFPPSAQVIYSDNFETGFAPEDRVVAGDILISSIKANM